MRFFSGINNQFSKINGERQAINQLRALSDRDLADMGLSRGMIRHAVRNGLADR